jgi:hypothetical protein
MSRFIDQLNRAARATSQPMGFRTARTVSSESRILLIASLAPGGVTERLADCADGADAVLLRLAKVGPTAKTLPKAAAALPVLPWGVWLEDTSAKRLATLAGAGGDFAVFPAASQAAAATPEAKTGLILQLEPSLGDSLLRTVNDLPVDAVLADDTHEAGATIAWHQLMALQRLSNLLTKPLIAPIPLNITDGELKALWEAGVDAVVVEVDTTQPKRLGELRRSIGQLPPRSLRKSGKAEALLPRAGVERNAAIPDEEDEEEYE